MRKRFIIGLGIAATVAICAGAYETSGSRGSDPAAIDPAHARDNAIAAARAPQLPFAQRLAAGSTSPSTTPDRMPMRPGSPGAIETGDDGLPVKATANQRALVNPARPVDVEKLRAELATTKLTGEQKRQLEAAFAREAKRNELVHGTNTMRERALAYTCASTASKQRYQQSTEAEQAEMRRQCGKHADELTKPAS